MKLRVTAAVLAALSVAGCSDNEARRFGYKGADLEDCEKMYFTTAPGVTNYVPARVLSVCESYEFTPDELALAGAVGPVMPGSSLKEIPEGYAKDDEGPWFVYWVKPGECLGFKGVGGFLAHHDGDKGEWATGQVYFSSYWKDEAEAKAALDRLEKTVAEKFHPKKFHKFANSWVAEFVRLRVMAVVGLKADGTWGCMLDVHDKNREGCGAWEPVEEQRERLEQFNYVKAVKEWKAKLPAVVAANHEAVAKARASRSLADLCADGEWTKAADGRNLLQRFGAFEFPDPGAGLTNAMDRVWAERTAEVERTTGVRLGDRTCDEVPGAVVAFAQGGNDLYEVRLDVAFPIPAAAGEQPPAEEGADPGERRGQYRVIVVESMQPGFAIPARPQPPKAR